jgi:hypothetical protein
MCGAPSCLPQHRAAVDPSYTRPLGPSTYLTMVYVVMAVAVPLWSVAEKVSV